MTNDRSSIANSRQVSDTDDTDTQQDPNSRQSSYNEAHDNGNHSANGSTGIKNTAKSLMKEGKANEDKLNKRLDTISNPVRIVECPSHAAQKKSLLEPHRDLVGPTAESIRIAQGKPPSEANGTFMTARRYLSSLAYVEKIRKIPLDELKGCFSPEQFVLRVGMLAQVMSRLSGQQTRTSDNDNSFWLSAERHISIMLIGAAHTSLDVHEYLRRTTTISFEKYLLDIQKDAFFTWNEDGKPGDMEIQYWIESEENALSEIHIGSFVLLNPGP